MSFIRKIVKLVTHVKFFSWLDSVLESQSSYNVDLRFFIYFFTRLMCFLDRKCVLKLKTISDRNIREQPAFMGISQKVVSF